MNTREAAKEYRLAHWAGVMQERVASGKNIKEYCESIGMHQNVYYYWQRKLRETACQELLPATNVSKSENAIVPNGWAVCGVAEDERKDGEVTIEIGKSRITVNANSDHEVLAKVCRVLTSLC